MLLQRARLPETPKTKNFNVKRLIGRKFEDQIVQADMKLWTFRVVRGTDSRPRIVIQFKGEDNKFYP